MLFLGIDPGLRITGYGVVEFLRGVPRLVDGGVIRLNVKSPLHERLAELDTELSAILTEFKPGICAIEQLYSHYNHPRTAILMGHARGVILLAAQRSGTRIEEFSSNRVKQSVVGHGHASKLQVQRTIQKLFNLPKPPNPPDVADALAVAVCAGRILKWKPK